ncbi:MAG: dihydrolipoyl dehydrogenase [Bacteroidales bacterium]|jgi:dihydrolipoamide dehydrogenase|nr:dihydrolipoyl dehydrogenase [Bacteroidales bacterium]
MFDVLIIGSGPGGYVAAIRAAQLGLKVAVVERAELGGICLNWGCIPTKSLLKSAEVFSYMKHAAEYGVTAGEVRADLVAVVARSRGVAEAMSKGIAFLFKKYGVEVISGEATLQANKSVLVRGNDGSIREVGAEHIILATGSRPRTLPDIPIDGEYVIGYREAMTLQQIPESMLVMGSGAIGSEFAHFYQTLGCSVTLVEYLPRVVPIEDEDTSAALSRAFRKNGMKILVDAGVEKVEIVDRVVVPETSDVGGWGYISTPQKSVCRVTVRTKKGEEIIEVDKVLSAVGVAPNTDNFENIGLDLEKGKVVVDEFYRASLAGYYAIGDITAGQALAHVASHEALVCVEKIAGLSPVPLDYNNIPACTYTTPEIASVGLTEQQSKAVGYSIKVGKFPFTASGKATVSGSRDGFVKVIFDEATDLMLGCHLVGDHVTEMIAEAVMIREKGIKAHDIIRAVHPHPTMSEALMEAVAVAYGEAVHV